jgi:regulatory protein
MKPAGKPTPMDAALHLLKYRGRTEKEMGEKLREKGFTPEECSSTVVRLKELNLVNDESLARSWTESGRRGGWGEQRLKQALWKRGVPRDLITRVLAEAPEEGAATESDRAKDALARRVKRLKTAGLDKQTLYRRLGGFLARQGFSPDVVSATLNSFLKSLKIESEDAGDFLP